MDIMRETALAYLAIYRREHNIYKVHITSAATLADSDRNRINAMVEKHLQGGIYTAAIKKSGNRRMTRPRCIFTKHA